MIKEGYPKLISKKSMNSSPTKPSTARSNHRRKSLSYDYDYKSEYSCNLNEPFEITQTPETRPFSVNIIKSKRNSSIFCDNELNRIEKELDEFEIRLEKSYQTSLFKINGEWEKYQKYLENVSICAIQKDSRLGNCIIRGIIGLTKIFKKLSKTIIESPIENKTISKKENFSQTEIEEADELRFCSSPELNSLKELQKKLKNIKFSRITGQLCDLYDSLCQMYTDIPSPTDTPDLIRFDSEEAAKELEKDVEELRNELTLKLVKKKTIKKTHEKECQADRAQNDVKREELLENLLGEKELDIFKLKHACEELLEEKAKWVEKLEAEKNRLNEDKKSQQNDQEIQRLRRRTYELESELRTESINTNILKEKFDRLRTNFESMKKENGSLKIKLVGKRRKLQENRESLFQTTIMWRMAEEKIKQIENAWKVKYGSEFVFREIDTIEIIKKYNIEKDQGSDNEINEEIGFEGGLVGNNGEMNNKNSNAKRRAEQSNSRNSQNKEYNVEDTGISFQDNNEERVNSKVIIEEFYYDQKQNADIWEKASNPSESQRKNYWFQKDVFTKDEKAQFNYSDANNSFSNEKPASEIDELAELAEIAAKNLIITLNKNQKELFDHYRQIMEQRIGEIKKISKLKSTRNKSNGPPKLSHRNFQYTRLQKKIKKTRPPPVGDSMFSSLGTSLIHTSKVQENAKEFFLTDALRSEKNEEIPLLLITLFKGDEDYWSLSPTTKKLLEKCMEGHDSQFCGEDCEHLKRVMKIKSKHQGTLYPIKKKNVEAKLRNILIYKQK